MPNTQHDLEALADLPHTCTDDWRVKCWACEASRLINDHDAEARALLKRYEAEKPKA